MKLMELCLSDGFGGLELYAAKVIRHYSSQGVPCVAVVKPGTLLDQRLEQGGVPRYNLTVWSTYFPLLAALKLTRLIRTGGITTLHIHSRKDLTLAVFAKLLSGNAPRLVYTRQMALTRPKYDAWHRFLYRQVDAYLTITRKLEQDAIQFLPLPADRIHTLYYGVPKPLRPTTEYCRDFIEQTGLTPGKMTIAIFGRIEAGKGQHLVIEAVSLLAREHYDIQAVIIGHVMDQTYMQTLKARVEKEGSEAVIRFAGFHPEPPSIMGCFDVVVLATKDETFGLVLAEAMRAGTAVIGSRAGGVPEIIRNGETGLLFESQNADDLATCLRRLLDEPELRERLARQGERFADQQFSEDKHFERLTVYLAGNG
jgi:glycosyltransferase involved in cell wall biosynthesis